MSKYPTLFENKYDNDKRVFGMYELLFFILKGRIKRGKYNSTWGLKEKEYRFLFGPLNCASNDDAKLRFNNSAPLNVFLFIKLVFNLGPV
jgi:hypothetical protein